MVKVRDVQPIMEHLLDRAEKAEKELEVYKKALKFACSGLGVGFCCKDDECDSDCVICWEEHLLNKAREEE